MPMFNVLSPVYSPVYLRGSNRYEHFEVDWIFRCGVIAPDAPEAMKIAKKSGIPCPVVELADESLRQMSLYRMEERSRVAA